MVKISKWLKNIFTKKKMFSPHFYDKKDFDECCEKHNQIKKDYDIF